MNIRDLICDEAEEEALTEEEALNAVRVLRRNIGTLSRNVCLLFFFPASV